MSCHYVHGMPESSPCGPVNSTRPVVNCCVNGDICLAGGVCLYEHSLEGGSGYYNAGCTDDSYPSQYSCFTRCEDKSLPDITYLSDQGVWACCANDNGERTCKTPSNETFKLAAPSDLPQIFSIPKAGFAYTSATIATSSPVSTTSSTASGTSNPAASGTSAASSDATSTSSGLSSGAAAGIGVGVAVAVIGLAFVLWRLYVRRQNEKLEDAAGSDGFGFNSNASNNNNNYPPSFHQSEGRTPVSQNYYPSMPPQSVNGSPNASPAAYYYKPGSPDPPAHVHELAQPPKQPPPQELPAKSHMETAELQG